MASTGIDVRNISWQQTVIAVALLGAVIAAYKLFGEIPAGVLLVISSVTNFLLGRADAKDTNKDGGK